MINRRNLFWALLPLSCIPALFWVGRGDGALALAGLYEGAEELGRCYLLDHPDESDQEALVELIRGPERQFGYWESASVRRFVLRRVQEDFDQNNVVNVCGWILARIEARICVLAALRAGVASKRSLS